MTGGSRNRTTRSQSVVGFLAHFLIVLAAWTVVIKYVMPIAFAWSEGAPLYTYVFWDLWPVVHLWLAWVLLHWQRYTAALALGVSVVEIAIVSTKFVLFLSEPQWTMWTSNWFVNKLFVLACFCLMLGTFVRAWLASGDRGWRWWLASEPPAALAGR